MADQHQLRLNAIAQRLGLDGTQRARLQTMFDGAAPRFDIEDLGAATPTLALSPPCLPTPPSAPPQAPKEKGDLKPDGQAEHIGPYTVLARLGVGGMGEVLRVLDPDLGRPMALKIQRKNKCHGKIARARFMAEARATARLQHPGIVPIHAMGKVEDGRLFYTMEEVRGRTLHAVIQELHTSATAAGNWISTPQGWTLRRVIDTLHRATQAIAYAHTRGVVHRDIKPANIMVGAFGEVRVLDWGIAKLLDRPDDAIGPITGTGQALETRAGAKVGTPAYMSPEQARGGGENIGPWSDIYALGITLCQVLGGKIPAWGAGRRILAGKRPIQPLDPPAPGPVPDELLQIMRRAAQPDPTLRYPDAAALAHDLESWLEGAQQRERALVLVDRADILHPKVQHAREQARALHTAAAALMQRLPSHAPIESKRAAWLSEDEGRRHERDARRAELNYEQLLQQALELSPGLLEAHDRLADIHRARHARAEAEGNDVRAAEEEVHLRRHGSRRHARYLAGHGALSLVTDPPGAHVQLHRYVEHDRRLVPEPLADLGTSPLVEHTLPAGRYRCTITAAGHHPVFYPFALRRREHWDGVPPGAHAPLPITLPRLDQLGPDDVYVPAGWFWSGDRERSKRDSLPWRRLWLDAFVIRRFQVTNADYIAFLDDLLDQGRQAEALQWAPHIEGTRTAAGPMIYGRDSTGRFKLVPDLDGDTWGPRWPVFNITFESAHAYARWVSAKSGHAWRLPWEFEWEKAARGIDGRIFPWGDYPEPTYANTRGSRPDTSFPEDVGSRPTDSSPYGMADAAGGACDLCADAYAVAGPPVSHEGRCLPPETVGDFHPGRGGSWTWPIGTCRADYRTHHSRSGPRIDTSFRLARQFLAECYTDPVPL